MAPVAFFAVLHCCSVVQQEKKEEGDGNVAAVTFYAALQRCCDGRDNISDNDNEVSKSILALVIVIVKFPIVS